MILVAECRLDAVVPEENVDMNGLVPGSVIATRLLMQLSHIKAIENFGYYLGVTDLKSIANAYKFDHSSKYILFPVTFHCRAFLPVKGEIMFGVVHSIHECGVFLKCGPLKYIYLSVRKMPNYVFVPGEKIFLSNDSSRIEKDVVVRFTVFATRWRLKSRDYHVLASLEGDSLGPVSLAGSDGIEL